MKNIIILQNSIFDYRRKVYNLLGDNYKCTVLHSGSPSKNIGDSYDEILMPHIKAGPFYFHNIFRLKKILNNFDVIICMFDLYWPSFIFSLYFFDKKKKIVFWGHRYSGNIIANYIRNSIMKKADYHLLYGSEDVEIMMRNGFQRSKIYIAPNTIHVSNHHDCSQFEKKSFIFVGRLQKSKRIDLLINIFSEIQPYIDKGIVLHIVGSGDEESKLKLLSKRLNISNRIYFHPTTNDDKILKDIFQSAYAYVSIGPVGLGVLHSFAYGVPVVTLKNLKHGPEFYNLQNLSNSIISQSYNELKNNLILISNFDCLSKGLGKNAYSYYIKNRRIEQMLQGFIDVINI